MNISDVGKRVTKKDTMEMGRTSSGIAGIVDTLRLKLQQLHDEIKTDMRSKAEYERQLAALERRKSDLNDKIRACRAWAEEYDGNVGPFAARYESMTSEIGGIYESAKKGHQRGLLLLQNEFGYHMAFRRPGDTFTGVPFRPR